MTHDRLRQAFGDLASDAPAGDGVLESAHNRINRQRTRRRVAAAAGSVAAIVLVIGGVAVLNETDARGPHVETPPAGSTPTTVSTEPPAPGVIVPNVVGSAVHQAQSTLQKLGFQVEIAMVASGSGPVNTVVAQDPPPATRLSPGGVVTLSVAAPPADVPEVTVPDVAHLSLGDATNALEALGLGTDTTGIDGPPTPDSDVIWQEPPAGAQATGTVMLWTCGSLDCPPYPADWYAGDGFANTPWRDASLGVGDLKAPTATELVDRVVLKLAEEKAGAAQRPTLSTRLVTEEDGAPLLVVSWRGFADDSVSGADFLVRLVFDGSSFSIGTTQTRELCARGGDAATCA